MNVKRTFQTLKTDFHLFCFNVKFVSSLFIYSDSDFRKSRSMDNSDLGDEGGRMKSEVKSATAW